MNEVCYIKELIERRVPFRWSHQCLEREDNFISLTNLGTEFALKLRVRDGDTLVLLSVF